MRLYSRGRCEMNREDRRTTRRQFVQKTLVLAPAPLILRAKSVRASQSAPPRAASDMVYYQGSVPDAKLAALDDTRLLATVDGPAGVISTDAARTWSSPVPYLQSGKSLQGIPHSVLKLRDGRLGMIYARKETVKRGSYVTPIRTWMYCHSEDEGK